MSGFILFICLFKHALNIYIWFIRIMRTFLPTSLITAESAEQTLRSYYKDSSK